MRKTGMIAAIMTAVFVLTGCGSIRITINTAKGPVDAGQREEALDGQYVTGPYGKLGIKVPDSWNCKVCPMGNEDMSYGYYGFMIQPKDVKEGVIAVFVANGFGVCGTELKQEEAVIAGRPACIGTYDGHDRWDFMIMGDKDPRIVATGGACDSWTDEQWQELQSVMVTVEFDPSVTEGAVWQYTPESEDTDIGVSMDLSHITPVGATVHFYRYDTGNEAELTYGESYILEKENDGKWEEVPRITDDAGFNDVAYIIPENDTCETETNWEWLYGPLSPGTYRMKKTVTEGSKGEYKDHGLEAQFLIAGPDAQKGTGSEGKD